MLDTTASSIQYRGEGGQSVFPIPFPFLETAHIRAHITDADGLTRSLAPGVDFTVNRISDGNGEFILLGASLAAGHLLAIRRLMPLTQEIFFHNQGPNSPRAMEEAADKLTMISQQLQAEIDNCLIAPDPETAAALSGTLAESAGRLASLETALTTKADAVHSHAVTEVSGLPASLAAKADAHHRHAIADVDGLSGALGDKLGVDDPRLERLGVGPHAASHGKGGADALTPADLGVLPAPPSDGKSYLAAGGGWIEYIAPAPSGGENPGTADHAQLGNRDAADQHPQSAIQNLTGDLAGIRAALSELNRADETLDGRLGVAESGVASATGAVIALDTRAGALDASVTELTGRVDGLGAMAHAADAPNDGKQYVRKNRAWAEALVQSSGGAGGGGEGIVGDIRLFSFRADALPSGWYFCNGDAYAVASAQGQALASLPESFRTDWGVKTVGSTISLPNLFDAATGAGMFLRGVDGASRLPGSAQSDAIRNITGSFAHNQNIGLVLVNSNQNLNSLLTGAFTRSATVSKTYSLNTVAHGSRSVGDLAFDASLAVPTAEENRPVNVGMTPAIYLGV